MESRSVANEKFAVLTHFAIKEKAANRDGRASVAFCAAMRTEVP
jgi:hypothetical protein